MRDGSQNLCMLGEHVDSFYLCAKEGFYMLHLHYGNKDLGSFVVVRMHYHSYYTLFGDYYINDNMESNLDLM